MYYFIFTADYKNQNNEENNNKENNNNINSKLLQLFEDFKLNNNYLILYTEGFILLKNTQDEKIQNMIIDFKKVFYINNNQTIKNTNNNIYYRDKKDSNMGEMIALILNIDAMKKSINNTMSEYFNLSLERYNNINIINKIKDIINKINNIFNDYIATVDEKNEFFGIINSCKNFRYIIKKFINNSQYCMENTVSFIHNIEKLFFIDSLLGGINIDYFKEQTLLYYELFETIINYKEAPESQENNNQFIDNKTKIKESIISFKTYINELFFINNIKVYKNKSFVIMENAEKSSVNKIAHNKKIDYVKQLDFVDNAAINTLKANITYMQYFMSKKMNSITTQLEQLISEQSFNIKDINTIKNILKNINNNISKKVKKNNFIIQIFKQIAFFFINNEYFKYQKHMNKHKEKILLLIKLLHNDLKNLSKNKQKFIKNISKLFNCYIEIFNKDKDYFQDQFKLQCELLDIIVDNLQ